MTLGQRISLYRKKLNISQEELGARLGVSRQAVSKWETDLSAPDLNNLIGLARELGVSVAELTETPEEPVPPKNTSKKWWFLLSVCVLLPVLIAGFLLYRINQPPAGQVSDYAEPASDFYLQWQVPRTDGREWYEFLTLGNQDVPFPFHTSLHLTAPEKIVTEGTDLHLAAVHHAVCGGLYVDYIRFQADPEQGQAAGDTICRISTMAPGFWTPRGISVGNEKSFVVDAYHSGKEDQAEGTLLYGLKEADGYSLVPHDYLYIWSAFEEGRGYQTIYFFIKDGLGNKYKFDFVITEIGGTVGDIESLPYLESIRQLKWELGKNALCVHLTYVPYLAAAGELKTKPTQHSVKELQSVGIQPDILVLRTEHELSMGLRKKVALFCNVDDNAVIQSMDMPTIYEVPLCMQEQKLDVTILRWKQCLRRFI